MPKPRIYTETKVIKITKVQASTLRKLERYNIRVCQFIRYAIFIGLYFVYLYIEIQEVDNKKLI